MALRDSEIFAQILKNTKLPNNELKFGNFSLALTTSENTQFPYEETDMLERNHKYSCNVYGGILQIFLWLRVDYDGYYRISGCVKKDISGCAETFSINFTTQKESRNIIYLTQKITFKEQCSTNKKLASEIRRQKQILLCQLLRKIGIDVTDNNDVILGIFEPETKKLLNTMPELLLNNFLAISILKGHFQGNKGYELDIIPTYQYKHYNSTSDVPNEENVLPQKISSAKSKRTIPLAFRYQVLKRDNSKCVTCGRGINDGAILHIDHKIPFSLGGLTVLDNLQTLCSECNISKSNRFID